MRDSFHVRADRVLRRLFQRGLGAPSWAIYARALSRFERVHAILAGRAAGR